MKILLLFACTFISFASHSQKVEIPDKNFEQALIDLKIDTDQEINGYLLINDAQKVTFLDVSNKKIKNLSGIEAFTSLSYLDCRNNQLSNLDLSQNIGLNMLFTNVNDLINSKSNFMKFVWVD